MRESDWQIRWNPLGESPEVLLDFGDLMEDEIARQLAASVAVGRFDFAPSATLATRKNLKRTLEFSRFIEHATNGEAVEECSARTLAGPWSKGLISLRHSEGGERLMQAALMSSDHDPDFSGPEPRSLHAYRFRVTPQALVPLGDPVTIIGGWYNPPGSGITIIIPGGSGVVPGGVITIPTGIPGVIPGSYPVTNVTPGGGGQDAVDIDVDHDQTPISDPPEFNFASAHEDSPSAGPSFWAKILGKVTLNNSVEIEVWHEPALGGPLGWRSFPAGSAELITENFDDVASQSFGRWNGLSIGTPVRPVAFDPTVATLKWRRLGDPAENTLAVPMRGNGEVILDFGTGGVQVFQPLIAVLTVTGDTAVWTIDGVINGGGTVQAFESP